MFSFNIYLKFIEKTNKIQTSYRIMFCLFLISIRMKIISWEKKKKKNHIIFIYAKKSKTYIFGFFIPLTYLA